MRAIVIQQYGGPEQLVIRELPDPEPAPGHVVVQVEAFGLNHAEIYFRRGMWGEVAKVSGIECAGMVTSDPDGHRPGQEVVALMGGMGRSFDGSYAEHTRTPLANVVPVESALSWPRLAALPESYATAWTCLYRNLSLQAGQIILVRGATSALGQAAVNIAAHAGARVIATTRNPARFPSLESIGAQTPVIDGPDLAARIRRLHPGGIRRGIGPGGQQHDRGLDVRGPPGRPRVYGGVPGRRRSDWLIQPHAAHAQRCSSQLLRQRVHIRVVRIPAVRYSVPGHCGPRRGGRLQSRTRSHFPFRGDPGCAPADGIESGQRKDCRHGLNRSRHTWKAMIQFMYRSRT